MGSSEFTVALRPIDVEGQPPTQVVAYFEATFKSPGARAFFDFWVTVEGRTTITAPSALLEAESREAGIKCAHCLLTVTAGPRSLRCSAPVSYTHLTLPTKA